MTYPFCGQLPYVFLTETNFQISDHNHQLGKDILKTEKNDHYSVIRRQPATANFLWSAHFTEV